MPLKIAQLIKTVSLAPDASGVSLSINKPAAHYVAMIIVSLLFLFDLTIGGYYYLILHSTDLPGYVFLTGGAIVAWAFTSLGITTNSTLSSNATVANTAATVANTAATVASGESHD